MSSLAALRSNSKASNVALFAAACSVSLFDAECFDGHDIRIARWYGKVATDRLRAQGVK